MTPEQWHHVTEVFHGAISITDTAAREAYLVSACRGDAEVRGQVDDLLAAHDEGGISDGTPDLLEDADGPKLTPGTTLGHYRVESLLGAGGMGEVYLARDLRLPRTVALKVLPPHLRANARWHARFEREARAIAALKHPRICPLHDIGQHDGIEFLVMEHVEGETLSARLRRGPLSIDRTLKYARQIADALAAAHNAGYIHRDIKPSNVIITPTDDVKVVDFGLARVAPTFSGDETTRPGVTEPGRVIGTPRYMSPEQALGRPLDARTDLFSLGVVMFECLTGQLPFTGDHRADYLQSLLSEDPRSVSGFRPGVPADLERLVARCLEREPVNRVDSAAWVSSELARLERGGSHGVLVRRPMLIGGLLAGLLIVAVWLAVGRPQPAPQEAAAPNPAAIRATLTRLGVLLPQNLTQRKDLDAWAPLVQTLFASELTGVEKLGVMDPMSLNARLVSGPTGRPTSSTEAARIAGLDLVIDTQIVSMEQGFQLRSSLVDAAGGDVRYVARADVTDDRGLPHAVSTLAAAILSYLQVSALGMPAGQDLRPWVSLRERNIEAVKAFVQANQYIFHYQLKEVGTFLQRAIALDPSFVAPRVWYISSLAARGERPEVEQQLAELKTLESAASPFDQAMIGFIGADVAGDRAAVIRYLELALTYSPGNNILLINLAGTRAGTGDCAGALKDLSGPIAGHWAFPPLYSVWGWCAVREGRIEEAHRVLKGALSLPAVDPFVYALLEGLELALGSTTEASTYGQRYRDRLRDLQAAPPTSEAVDVFERLVSHCQAAGQLDRVARLQERLKIHQSVSRSSIPKE